MGVLMEGYNGSFDKHRCPVNIKIKRVFFGAWSRKNTINSKYYPLESLKVNCTVKLYISFPWYFTLFFRQDGKKISTRIWNLSKQNERLKMFFFLLIKQMDISKTKIILEKCSKIYTTTVQFHIFKDYQKY